MKHTAALSARRRLPLYAAALVVVLLASACANRDDTGVATPDQATTSTETPTPTASLEDPNPSATPEPTEDADSSDRVVPPGQIIRFRSRFDQLGGTDDLDDDQAADIILSASEYEVSPVLLTSVYRYFLYDLGYATDEAAEAAASALAESKKLQFSDLDNSVEGWLRVIGAMARESNYYSSGLVGNLRMLKWRSLTSKEIDVLSAVIVDPVLQPMISDRFFEQLVKNVVDGGSPVDQDMKDEFGREALRFFRFFDELLPNYRAQVVDDLLKTLIAHDAVFVQLDSEYAVSELIERVLSPRRVQYFRDLEKVPSYELLEEWYIRDKNVPELRGEQALRMWLIAPIGILDTDTFEKMQREICEAGGKDVYYRLFSYQKDHDEYAAQLGLTELVNCL